MKALVIGANGYLGRHLVHFLVAKGDIVTIADISPEAKDPQFDYIQCDASKYEAMLQLPIADMDVIYFFTGLTGTSAGFQRYEDFIKVNEVTLLHLLRAHTELGSKARIIFPSTRLVYKGQANIPLVEEAEKEFKTVYAINKYACEQYLEMWGRTYDTPYVILRLCVPYGNMLDSAYSYGTLGFFLNKASAGEAISLYGDGSLRRTFSHVTDVCTYFHIAATKADMNQGIYNIPGDNKSLKEVAEKIASKFNASILYVPFPEMDAKIESGDTIFNGDKIIQYTNYSNQYTVESWIEGLF